MSRNIVPVILTIGFGVFTSYYTFQPALQQLAMEKAQGGQPSAAPGRSSPPKETVDTPAANTKPAAPSPKPEQAKSETEKST